MEDSGAPSRSFRIVIAQRTWRVHLLFGFLMAIFATALIRGHVGATTNSGRIVVDALFGLLAIGTVGAWLRLSRRPAHLEISPEAITLSYRGGGGSQQLLRSSGDLYVGWSGGRYPQPYLRNVGTREGLALWTFSRSEVSRACTTMGWRFAAHRD